MVLECEGKCETALLAEVGGVVAMEHRGRGGGCRRGRRWGEDCNLEGCEEGKVVFGGGGTVPGGGCVFGVALLGGGVGEEREDICKHFGCGCGVWVLEW